MKKLSSILLSLIVSISIVTLSTIDPPQTEAQELPEHQTVNYKVVSFNEQTGHYKAINEAKNISILFTESDAINTIKVNDYITAKFNYDYLEYVYFNHNLILAEDKSIIDKLSKISNKH